MKISFKYLLLFFAVGMMSVVSCSDDDSEEPKPPTGNTGGGNNGGGNNGGDQFTTGIFAIVNQDSIDFTTYSAVLDESSDPFVVKVKGSNSSKNASIGITLGENFTGTFDASQPTTEQGVTFTLNSIPFSPKSGSVTVSQNDSAVAGTFEFIGSPTFGSDTLTVTNGKFNIKF